jgi:phosphate-selective porin OprO/OprP
LQAEWYGTTVDQIGGGPVFLHGCYAYVSYFVTGEARAYDRKEGAFDRIRVLSPFLWLKGHPNLGRGPGAWELVARFAYLDFNDPNMPKTSDGLKQGDSLAETTLGVNWYLNENARLMFNYVHAIPVDPNFGPSAADAFFFRTEVFW